MYKLFFILSFFITSRQLTAQLPPADFKKLQAKEDSLRQWAKYMITDSLTEDRMISDSTFTKILVRALLVKNSFYYPFDSVLGIAKIYAPDSSFRIFTWNLEYDSYYSRQRGAIQMRSRDGSLKLFPLRDVSEFTINARDSVRTPKNWIGAVYYNVTQTNYNGKNYYTLFGIDYHNLKSTKKWIEVLHFGTKGEPLFGGPFFTYGTKQKPKYRVMLEFKKDAKVLVDYMTDMGMIITEHLVSETDQPELPQTLVPDGDNEGYKWKNGKWLYIEKVFTSVLQDGSAPREVPVFDKKTPPKN